MAGLSGFESQLQTISFDFMDISDELDRVLEKMGD